MHTLLGLTHAPGGQARQLLAFDADLTRLLDFRAQLAQALAVDVPARGQCGDPLQRRSQRAGNFGAEFGDEPSPVLEIDRVTGLVRFRALRRGDFWLVHDGSR